MPRTLFHISRAVIALGLGAGLMLAAPAPAETVAGQSPAPEKPVQEKPAQEKIVFDVELKGIAAGRLAINGVSDGARYSAAGVLETTGLVGMVRKIRYSAQVAGREGTRMRPETYSETADTPKRQSVFEMSYKAGTPVKVSQTPPRKPRDYDLALANQGGTIDPLSALYAVLRTVSPDQACTFAATMFDGARRTEVKLFAPKPQGTGVVCSGEYRRLGGFSPKDMAEKTVMAFSLTYEPTPDGRLKVTEVATDTIYGKGRLKRR